MTGATDPPAQLIQLSQAEGVGTIHEDCIGVGDIETGFDDSRGQQHVRFLPVKFQHYGLHQAGVHLTMRNNDSRLRNQISQPSAGAFDSVDSVVNEEHLAAATQLTKNRLANESLSETRDLRANRQAIGGRGFDHRQLAKAGHRHLQRARNRSGGQGEDVQLCPQLLEAFLVLHPEPLFLINHEEAQIAKLYVLLQEAMGADDDIQGPVRESTQARFLLSRVLKATEHPHLDREGREPLRKGLKMLLSQQCGGNHDGGLLVVHDSLEDGAHGDFSLAVTYVPANKAVHGLFRFHVPSHVLDRAKLIVCLLILESGIELVRENAFCREGWSDADFAGRLHRDQIFGHFLDAFAHATLGALPRLASESIKLGDVLSRAEIALHLIEAVQRHIDLIVADIFEDQIVAGESVNGKPLQSNVSANAVLNVDDIIAHLQLLHRFQKCSAFGRRRNLVPGAFCE